MVDAVGGSVKGVPATTVTPPTVAGYKKFDLYPSPGNKGDVAKAKQYLSKCGKPNGFSTTTRRQEPSGPVVRPCSWSWPMTSPKNLGGMER